MDVHNSKIKSPSFSVLYSSIARHFALREVNRNQLRNIRLVLNDVRIRGSKPVKYYPPEGNLKISHTIKIPELGDCFIEIYEASDKLDFTLYDPSSEAGILVKSDGIVLDNRLFGFENDEVAHFFFGWADCLGISKTIREGDQGIVDPNRSGLDWRYHLCKTLSNEIYKILKPLVENKKKELEITRKTGIKEEFKEKLEKLCSLLNQLAQDELDEISGPWKSPLEIDSFIICPDIGYAEPNHTRSFSVYLPASFIEDNKTQPLVKLELAEVIGQVELINDSTFLNQHPNYEHLLMGYFRIVGRHDSSSAYIIAKVNDLEDIAEFRVRRPGKRPRGGTGGLFKNIEFDDRTPDPIQRVSFMQGIITVFVNFAPIRHYLGPGGDGMASYQGSLMLAELVSEAFCTELARRRIEAGIVPIVPGGEIDGYRSEVNKLMRRHLKHIHRAITLTED